MIRKIGFAILLVAIVAATALAQQADPPSRVARLNFLNGAVSFRPGSIEDWSPATLNYPLTNGDHLWADADSRAEMHIGSTAIRMDAQTALSVLTLDDNVAQISLTEGVIDVHVRNLESGETYEIDTPNSSVILRQAGDYRISARGDDNTSQVTVLSGEADINAGSSGFPLYNGQSVRLAGQDQVAQQMMPPGPRDGFDDWCSTRDRREAGSVSARYVPRDMIGYEDLDEYGVWREVPQYGMVWAPRGVGVGWAPYHAGHWAWVEPWGWTWIDDAPWGFAPFHYGRWAFAGGGWVWVPGRMEVGVRVRPVYAPALVAFVGGGGFSVGVGVGGGGMAAWFPLGPGEVFVPAYHVSPRYVENINIVHVTNVTVIRNVNVTNVRYVNQSVVGAVTVVPHDAFIHSRRVTEVAIVVPREQIMRAQVIGTTAQVAPIRESVVVHRTDVVVRTPPTRIVERQVVVRHEPPPPPVSFREKERVLQTNGGRPLDSTQQQSLRHTAPDRNPVVRTNNPGNGNGNGNGNNTGGRRFGTEPANTGNPTNNNPTNNNPNNNNPNRPGVDRNNRPPSNRQDPTTQPPPHPQPQPTTTTPPPVHTDPHPAEQKAVEPTHTNEAHPKGETPPQKGERRAPPKKGDTKKQ